MHVHLSPRSLIWKSK